MDITQSARSDLREIIDRFGAVERSNCQTWPRSIPHYNAAQHMREKGWKINEQTMPETARSLGFTVIGLRIYQLQYTLENE